MKQPTWKIEYNPGFARKTRSARDFLAARSRNGIYFRSLLAAWQAFRRDASDAHLRTLATHLVRMLLGERLTTAVLPDHDVVLTGECTPDRQLYHFAPAVLKKQILSSGLRARKRYVYLTDAPQETEKTFLPWKTTQIRKTTVYTLLEIDVPRLLNKQKIFRTNRPHEYVTGSIDAAYISVVPDGQEKKGEQ